MSDTRQGHPSISDEQTALFLAAMQLVQDSPDGCGTVQVESKASLPRFIRITFSIDLQYPQLGLDIVRQLHAGIMAMKGERKR